jgi:DNA-binding MarR family transcriptional regulator
MAAPPPRQAAPPARAVQLADRLHSAAIHLLRRLRVEDSAAGLTAPRLSALSVIVFRGPLTLSELAAAEQVRPPTITRLVQELEREGLVVRLPDPADRRITRVRATPRGRRLLHQGRARRVQRLARDLVRASPADRALLEQAAQVLEAMLADRTSARETRRP